MKKSLIMVFLPLIILLLINVPNISATSFGTNWTVWDRMGSGTGWTGTQEDNEVEPGCSTGHIWDLEAFFLNGLDLTVVATFDLQNGQSGQLPGDIFIDVDGDAVYGPDNHPSGTSNSVIDNVFGYDYVFHFTDLSAMKYDLYAIDENTKVKSIYFGGNQESNPWVWASGGTQISTTGLTADYVTGLTDAQVGGLTGEYWGYKHNALTVSLAPIQADMLGNLFKQNVTFHYTMQCGNDNLMGVTPEPGTMILLGSGLLGFGIIARIRKRK